MRQNNTLLVLFLLFHCVCFPQQNERLLRGTTVSDSILVSGITVMNLVNEQVTVTGEKGEFSIMAKEDDLLIFSAVNYEYKRKIVELADLDKGYILIKLIPKVEQLQEVVVLQDISPETLGIVPKGQKKYTPAERRLKAAGDLSPQFFLPFPAFSMQLDPVINAITGRTRMLKKEVAVEKKTLHLKKISELFQERYYTDKLKIPMENVPGFQYYLIDNSAFVMALESGNKTRMQLIMSQLSLTFKDHLSAENK